MLKRSLAGIRVTRCTLLGSVPLLILVALCGCHRSKATAVEMCVYSVAPKQSPEDSARLAKLGPYRVEVKINAHVPCDSLPKHLRRREPVA